MCNTIMVEADNNGPNKRPRWRLLHTLKMARTPWMNGTVSGSPDVYHAAKQSLLTFDRNMFNPARHTHDGLWVVVHGL